MPIRDLKFVESEEFCLLGYNLVLLVESQETFRRNECHPPFDLSTSVSCYFLLGLFLVGGDMFLRNVN